MREKTHYLNNCNEFKKLRTSQVVKWIKDGNRCWRCGLFADVCVLKSPCKLCKEQHLTVLHDSVQETLRAVFMVHLPLTHIYLDHPKRSQKVC